MRITIEKIFLFACLTLSLYISGCVSQPNNETFILESYKWSDVPRDIQNQVEGAGCEYLQQNNEGAIYMINGLVKINGIYEILTEKEIDHQNYTKEVYENSRWVIYVDIIKATPNDTEEKGTLTLRSKEKDGTAVVQIQRFCGT